MKFQENQPSGVVVFRRVQLRGRGGEVVAYEQADGLSEERCFSEHHQSTQTYFKGTKTMVFLAA